MCISAENGERETWKKRLRNWVQDHHAGLDVMGRVSDVAFLGKKLQNLLL